ncbi:MAG: hypothetical protein H5T62_16635 [Anaerolineae bacterium]|nr:hypothetical protein [Anaerolineae bacterium]
MEGKNASASISAARVTSAIFGVLSGLGGITHGIGEMLQGNVAPEGIIINSWTQGPIATNMGGEPGMTIVPNLLVTGALTSIVSLALIIWSVAFVHRKHGGLVQLLLSIAMLLVGGGFGPPIIGMLASVAGFGINAPYTGWRVRLPFNVRRILARLWPWVFAVCVANGVFLVIGSVILVYFCDLNNPDLFTNSFFLVILSLPPAIFLGVAYDIVKGFTPTPSRFE